MEDWIEATIQKAGISDSGTDALEYCHGVLGKIAELCVSVGHQSPISPKPLVLTEADLAGPVTIIEP